MESHASLKLKEAAVISDLRGRTCLTQEDFAREVGVTVSTVSRWENGHTTPSRLARQALEDMATRLSRLPSKLGTDHLA